MLTGRRWTMVEKIVSKLVRELIGNEIIDISQKEEYEYAIICQLESFITIGSIVLISLLFDNLIPTVCFLTFFLSLRKRTGGYHLDSFIGCYMGTMCVYVGVVFLCHVTCNYFNYIKIITLIASLYIGIIGTVNHPNMDLDDEELRYSKSSARLVLIIEIFAIMFLCWMNIDLNVVSYSIWGIILCAILLLLAKLKKQEIK